MINFQSRVGYTFANASLIEQAFTHKSFHNERQGSSGGHNERLEFLGDAVLDLALSDLLMEAFPEFEEGDLSKLRASLVNETVLAEIALEFEFQKLLRLGRGEVLSGGAMKPRLLASALEAFVGAFYQEAGFERVKNFLKEVFTERLKALDLKTFFAADYKTRLQEMMQEKHRQTPVYEVISEEGPDHDKVFHVTVQMNGAVLAKGSGRSKKQAEQDAARRAIEEKV